MIRPSVALADSLCGNESRQAINDLWHLKDANGRRAIRVISTKSLWHVS